MWRMIYEQLQHQYPTVTVDEWWGIDEPFERMVGSVMVQNTTWTNAMLMQDVFMNESRERRANMGRFARR